MVAELKRLFLGVAVDSQVKAMLAQHLASWTVPGKLVPADNWHLTIRFLGSLDETRTEILAARIDQTDLGPPFTLVLGEMGAFPASNRANVLWLGVDDQAQGLNGLNSVIEEACRDSGLPPEERPFSAHLTLSRLRPPESVVNLIASYGGLRFQWTVKELTLFESRPGPIYDRIERFPLRPQASSRR